MAERQVFADEKAIDDALRECQIRRTNGENLEGTIQYIHSAGFSILDCMKIVRRMQHIGLDQAKDLVTSHQSWSTETEQMQTFARGLLEGLESDKSIESPNHQEADDHGVQ